MLHACSPLANVVNAFTLVGGSGAPPSLRDVFQSVIDPFANIAVWALYYEASTVCLLQLSMIPGQAAMRALTAIVGHLGGLVLGEF